MFHNRFKKIFLKLLFFLILILSVKTKGAVAQSNGFLGPRVIAKGNINPEGDAPQLFSDGDSIFVMFPDDKKVLEFDRTGKEVKNFSWDRPKESVGWDKMFVSRNSIFIVNRAQDRKKIYRIDRRSGSQDTALNPDIESYDDLVISDAGLFEARQNHANAKASKISFKKIFGPKIDGQKEVKEEDFEYLGYSDDRKKVFLTIKGSDRVLWTIETPKEWSDFLTLELVGQDSSGKMIVEVGWCSPVGTEVCGPDAPKQWKLFLLNKMGRKVLAQADVSIENMLPRIVLAKDGTVDRVSFEKGVWQVLSWTYNAK